ncbi:TRAFAC clade GTPase domain-containing protein [Verrucomicrobiota bacterium sgz303538]
MSGRCTYEGCTVAETGRCALERNPTTCPNRIGNLSDTGLDTASEAPVANVDVGAPVLQSPDENPSFARSGTLGLKEIGEMMRRRYVTVVGILGDPESGKTACLASLYLLISNAMLDGWSFADSRSLMAFEEIARGARRWNEGQPPEQMTVHTEMADERQPGFLHLRLRRKTDGRIVDLALPDLPGEWTKTLIRSARSDRFEFLRSADVIWLILDGRILADRERRQGTITRLGQLSGRLCALIEGAMPRVLLVITHRDLHEPDQAVIARITSELAKHGVSFELIPVAPFSKSKKIKAGFGLAALVTATVERPSAATIFWPTTSPAPGASSFLSYRRDQ